jgi:phosphoribosylformylglycinamidine synthase
MVGRLPDAAAAGRLGFARAGDALAFVGPFVPHLPGSELAKLRGEPLPRDLPEVDLEAARTALEVVREAVRSGDVSSAHDAAEGGFAVAVAEAAIAGGLGARIDFAPPGEGLDRFLFGEGSGGFVLTGPREVFDRMAERIPVTVLGEVGGEALIVELGAEERLEWTVAELREAWAGGLAPLFP